MDFDQVAVNGVNSNGFLSSHVEDEAELDSFFQHDMIRSILRDEDAE